MYALGEKYQVPSLKSAAQDAFQNILSEDYGCIYTDWFREAARIAYTSTISTDHGLRDIVSGAVSETGDSIDREFMRKLLEEQEDMTIDVLLALVQSKNNTWEMEA